MSEDKFDSAYKALAFKFAGIIMKEIDLDDVDYVEEEIKRVTGKTISVRKTIIDLLEGKDVSLKDLCFILTSSSDDQSLASLLSDYF